MTCNTYATDVEFLKRHVELVELTLDEGASVAVAPTYQGRVMTSSLDALAGASFGWINEAFIAAARDDPHWNNYGGEDRFWLGPEAGQFGLWFRPGDKFDTDHWKTPAGFDRGAFDVSAVEDDRISMSTQFGVTNYSGTTFNCAVKRTISALGRDRAGELLEATIVEDVAMVGFESSNSLTNSGDEPWTHESGLLSIWTLGQFKAPPDGKVIIPFIGGDDSVRGRPPTTDYFGQIPPDRCRVADDYLLLTCDGKWRSKIGIAPPRARSTCGSYDPEGGVLTIVQFSLPSDAGRRPYVNSLWEIQDDPFAGDVVNSYNDGEVTPGAGQMGAFYELETSSPAAALKPGESITHEHRTFHFAGPFDPLNKLSKKILGVDLAAIR